MHIWNAKSVLWFPETDLGRQGVPALGCRPVSRRLHPLLSRLWSVRFDPAPKQLCVSVSITDRSCRDWKVSMRHSFDNHDRRVIRRSPLPSRNHPSGYRRHDSIETRVFRTAAPPCGKGSLDNPGLKNKAPARLSDLTGTSLDDSRGNRAANCNTYN